MHMLQTSSSVASTIHYLFLYLNSSILSMVFVVETVKQQEILHFPVDL